MVEVAQANLELARLSETDWSRVSGSDSTARERRRAELRRRSCATLLEALRQSGVILPRRGYEPGELIYSEGDEAGSLYVVERGVVALRGEYAAQAGPRHATLGLVGSREVFGGPTFTSVARKASAEAFGGCEVLKVSRPLLERAMRERRQAALALANVFELALEERQQLIQCLLLRKTIARLARLLPILAGRFGYFGRGRPRIRLRLTRQELAEMVCASRESVGQAMDELRQREVIEMEEGRVAIVDPKRLDGIGR